MLKLWGNGYLQGQVPRGEHKANIPAMSSPAAIRLQVETKLANRVPAALTLKIKQAPELFATGIAEVDAVLGGGIPRGSITEISGSASTGKTSFGLSAVAAITRSGAACAWVDVGDALSPESAAAAKIALKRMVLHQL